MCRSIICFIYFAVKETLLRWKTKILVACAKCIWFRVFPSHCTFVTVLQVSAEVYHRIWCFTQYKDERHDFLKSLCLHLWSLATMYSIEAKLYSVPSKQLLYLPVMLSVNDRNQSGVIIHDCWIIIVEVKLPMNRVWGNFPEKSCDCTL